MSRSKRILFGIIIFVAVFTISVLFRNTRNTVNYSSSVNYLDIQMEIHHRMYVLIMAIGRLYQDSPEDIGLLLNYTEKLHKEAMILGNSNSNKLAKIITCAEDPESLRWVHEQLIWVVQPMDEVGDSRDAKMVMLIMTPAIEYLHSSVRFLSGDKIEEEMTRVEDFKKKFKK